MNCFNLFIKRDLSLDTGISYGHEDKSLAEVKAKNKLSPKVGDNNDDAFCDAITGHFSFELP